MTNEQRIRLLDYFAAAALNSLMMKVGEEKIIKQIELDYLCDTAFEVAASMLKSRDRVLMELNLEEVLNRS